MAATCETCRRLSESPITAWLSLVGQAIDGGALDDAAHAASELRRYGIELRLVPARMRRGEGDVDERAADGR
jgi:hypothetical protein